MSNPNPIAPCEIQKQKEQQASKSQNSNEGQDAQQSKVEKYDGIRIYPLRYGVYKEKYVDTELDIFLSPETNNEKIKSLAEKGMIGKGAFYPDVENYGYRLHYMPLREGWLYVQSKVKDGVYEFSFNGQKFVKRDFIKAGEIEKDGWNIDVGNGPFLSLSDKDLIYLFYSEVRLSKEAMMHNLIKNKASAAVRFDCAKWSSTDGISSTDPHIRIMDSADVAVRFPTSEAYGYNKEFIDNYIQVLKTAINNNKEKVCKRDVFIGIDDPIGFANQVSVDLQDKHLDHEALIRSIRTGQSFGLIRNALLNHSGSVDNGVISDEQLLSGETSINQYINMHSMAILLHTLFYRNKQGSKYLEKTSRSVSESNISKILGNDIRKAVREEIENLRKFLAYIIDSALFQNYCQFFSSSPKPSTHSSEDRQMKHDEMLLGVKSLIMESFKVLTVLPHTKDTYIDGETKNYIDPCQQTIDNAVNESNEIGKLLYKEIDIETLALDYDGSSSPNVDAAFALVNTMLISFWRTIFKTTEDIIFNARMFENNSKVGLFLVNRDELDATLKKMQRRIINKLDDNGRIIQTYQKAANGQYRFLKSADFSIEKQYFKATTESIIKDDLKNYKYWRNKSAKGVEYIARHPAYLGIMSMFYVKSIFSLSKQDWSENIQANIVALIQTGLGIASLRVLVLENITERKLPATIVEKGLKLRGLGLAFDKIGVIGSVVELFDSLMNAFILFGKKDYDAMAVYVCAAGVTGIGLAVALGSKLVSALTAGWIGLVCAVIVFGLQILAEYFKDTEMEIYIKQTIFSNLEELKFDFQDQKENYYKDIVISATTKTIERANGSLLLTKYFILLEEFMICHLFIPNLQVNFSYMIEDVIYAVGRAPSMLSRVKGVRLGFSLNLSGFNYDISGFNIYSYFTSNYKKENKAISLSSCMENDLFMTSKEIKDNVSEHNFVIVRDKFKNEFFHYFLTTRETSYIVSFVQLVTKDNRTYPFAREGQKQVYIRYIHEVNVRKPLGSQQLDYYNVSTSLKEVKIVVEGKAWA